MAGEKAPITCDNCTSACCRAGTRLALTDSDARFLKAGGTALGIKMHPKQIGKMVAQGEPRKPASEFTRKDAKKTRRYRLAQWLKDRDPSWSTGQFTLKSDCGYLQTGKDGVTFCGVYEDPRRPATCRKFKAGSHHCRQIRVDAGVDEEY
ncbi:MAG: hypothetical protein V4449_00180 [Patescibacteria group bacterium]